MTWESKDWISVSGARKLKILLVALLVATSAVAEDFKYDPNTPEALAVQAKYAAFAKEAQALSTFDLFKELQRLEAAEQARRALMTPEDSLKSSFLMSDDGMRSISFSSVLSKRSDTGEVTASFYYSVYQWPYCNMWQRLNTAQGNRMALDCWQKAMEGFKRASQAGVSDATTNIARMYANGFGVTSSKFVAADWYVKAADQYNATKDRDEALTAVESALNLVPDHPAALRLRKAMVK